MNTEITSLKEEIKQAIAEDKLSLPTLPEVAMRVRDVASDENATLASLVRVISSDPALSARLLRVSNSPLLRRSEKPVTDLKTCVTNLGTQYAANLAVGIAMAQMYQASHKSISDRMHASWNLSTDVAGLCQVMCHVSSSLSPSMAMLAGLIHNIGVLPVLTYADSNQTLLNDPTLLDEAIRVLHPDLGDMILRHWNFHEQLAHIPSQYLQFDREVDTADYADVVTFAVLETATGTTSPLAQVDKSTVGAYKRLNLGEGQEQSDDARAAAQYSSNALK